MQQTPIVDSIASSIGSIGESASRHMDLYFRDMLRGQGAVEGERYMRLITGERHTVGNMAIIWDASCQETTETAVAPLLQLRVPTMVVYTTGVSDAIAQKLVGQGFEQAAMPAMAIDIERMTSTVLPSGYECIRVVAGKDGSEWAEVLGICDFMPPRLARMLSPEVLGADMAPNAQTQFFGIRYNGRLVAISQLYLADGLAGIYCVGTLPEERRKGLGAHVTAEALRVAHRLRYRVGVLQASDEGHSVYLRLGFKDVGSLPRFVRRSA